MRSIRRSFVASCCLALASCAGGPEPTEDAGPDVACIDEDGDGYGVGADCLGPDCNDGNRNVWREEQCNPGCEPDDHSPGCECDPAEFPDPESCYEGREGTEGVGRCLPGTRTCEDGEWSLCVDQVTPTGETCNYIDDNCDGETDEGVASPCGCGLTVGIGCAEPFAPNEVNSSGVETDGEGALVLGLESADGFYYHHFVEPCTAKANNPQWRQIGWEAEVPDGCSLFFEARTEACEGAPGSEPWVPIADVPDDEAPADIRAAFAAAGEPMPITCLGVRVTLAGPGAGPRVLSIAANLTCR